MYQEELCGYMAGYAAVKLGYTSWASWAAWRFPPSCVTATASCRALTTLQRSWLRPQNYAYANQFKWRSDITAAMDTWYQGGTEVRVFACGGGVFDLHRLQAAANVNGKIIGVDVDQSGIIDGQYGKA